MFYIGCIEHYKIGKKRESEREKQLLTLGAHAPEGYGSCPVCVSVCVCVCVCVCVLVVQDQPVVI